MVRYVMQCETWRPSFSHGRTHKARPLAKSNVQEVMPDSNGLVRRVRVRTAENPDLCRDIRKICLLEGYIDELND